MSEDVVIVGGARTPFCEWVGGKRGDGKAGGALKTVSAQELGAIAIEGALEKTGTSPGAVDHVVMGYALQTCSQSIYGARHAGLKAGIPQEVPMLTLSRICGSGIQSIISGAQMIMLGGQISGSSSVPARTRIGCSGPMTVLLYICEPHFAQKARSTVLPLSATRRIAAISPK